MVWDGLGGLIGVDLHDLVVLVVCCFEWKIEVKTGLEEE